MNVNTRRQAGAGVPGGSPAHHRGCTCAACTRGAEAELGELGRRMRPAVASGAGAARRLHPARCTCRACRGVQRTVGPEQGGGEVRWIQGALNAALGLRLPLSGRLDAQTRSAVRSLQRRGGTPENEPAGPPPTAAPPEPAGDGPESEVAYGAGSLATPESLAPVPGSEKVSREFKLRVIGIARDLGTDPNFLMAIMSFESNLDPRAVNASSGATGLIQFMPSTALKLGTTVGALKGMGAEGQLDYVAQYFAPYRNQLRTLEDAYMAVLWPPGIGQGGGYVLFRSPSSAYQQNSVLDLNGDGSITVAEATSFVYKRLGRSAPAPGAPVSRGPTGPRPTLPLDRSSREYVSWVQQSLNRLLGIRLVVDGVSGTQTRSAARTFQQQKGLAADGIVGPVTEAALITAGVPRPPGFRSGQPAPPSSGPAPTADTARLARQLLNHSRVTLVTSSTTPNGSPRQNLLDTAQGRPARSGCYTPSKCGATVQLSATMLQALLNLANQGHAFVVTSFAGGKHSEASDHYAGRAVDIGNWNKTSLGTPNSAHTAARNALIAAGASERQTFNAFHDTSTPSHKDHVHAAFY